MQRQMDSTHTLDDEQRMHGPTEQLLQEMGLDTSYADQFMISPLISEIIVLEKSACFQQERTATGTYSERARVSLINELSIKKNVLIRILYKLEEKFAHQKRLSSKKTMTLLDRQERAAFVRNVSKKEIFNMLNEIVNELENLLQSPPKEFKSEDLTLTETARKLALELLQVFSES